MTYQQWETERKRCYRAQQRVPQSTPPTPVGVRDTGVDYPARQQGDRSREVLTLRAEGKSQNEIAKLLGLKRSTIATILRGNRGATLTAPADAERTSQEYGPSVAT